MCFHSQKAEYPENKISFCQEGVGERDEASKRTERARWVKGEVKERTKAEALVELEGAKRSLEKLTKKLQTVNEAKELAGKATETAKNQLDHGQTDSAGDDNAVWRRDLDTTKEQYNGAVTELDAAKQALRKICGVREAAMEEKYATRKQATDTEATYKANFIRVGELSKEIVFLQKTIDQVKLATIEAE